MVRPVLPAPHIQPVFEALVATSPPVFSPFINYNYKSYFSNRTQHVQIDVLSDVANIICGVLQGLVLGHFFFTYCQ